MKIISTNPSRNYELVGEVESSSDQEIEDRLFLASEVQPMWANLSQLERNNFVESFVSVINKHAEEIAAAMSREMGKPIKLSRQDIKETSDYYHVFMKLADEALKPKEVFEDKLSKHTQLREPLGVLVCITPWNFPLFNLVFQFGAALLSGNTILYKPSEEIIVFAKLIEKLIAESNLPEGVFNVLYGDGKVGEKLVQLPIDGVLFTGSTRTGQRITELAAKRSTPVLTEMGGSSPGIIFEDADVESVIDTVYRMRMDNTGQYCDGLKRLIVHESKLGEVLSGLKKVNATKVVGDALDDKTDLGPLVAKRQLDLLKSQVEDAVSKGAKLLFGGKEPEKLQGAYYEPTVLTDVAFDMRVWREEVFGPVLPIVTFKSEAEAVELANDTTYGLSAYVFTKDKQMFERVAAKLKAGSIAHNNSLYFSPYSPFGGYKGSGNSRVCGEEGFFEVTRTKLLAEDK